MAVYRTTRTTIRHHLTDLALGVAIGVPLGIVVWILTVIARFG